MSSRAYGVMRDEVMVMPNDVDTTGVVKANEDQPGNGGGSGPVPAMVPQEKPSVWIPKSTGGKVAFFWILMSISLFVAVASYSKHNLATDAIGSFIITANAYWLMFAGVRAILNKSSRVHTRKELKLPIIGDMLLGISIMCSILLAIFIGAMAFLRQK